MPMQVKILMTTTPKPSGLPQDYVYASMSEMEQSTSKYKESLCNVAAL